MLKDLLLEVINQSTLLIAIMVMLSVPLGYQALLKFT